VGNNAKDVLLATLPALFGLIGTIVGAIVTKHAATIERRVKEDSEARTRLADVITVIDRVSWFGKGGVVTPNDLGPGGIADALRGTVAVARAALLTVGIHYDVASAGLEPAQRLAFRLDTRTLDPQDPDDARTVVAFLLGLIDRRHAYRRSGRASSRLFALEALARGRRPVEGVPETQLPFGRLPSPHGN
jgi:hypothetical protein